MSAAEYAALKADIAQNGVQLPVAVDQYGRILDGNNRAQIATELGIDYPTTTIVVDDDGDAVDRAVSLNCQRRHLTREQQREIIRAEITRRPDDSDRSIARRVGCSPTTVGTVRQGKVSNLDTQSGWATDITERLREEMTSLAEAVRFAVEFAFSNGIEQIDIIRALVEGRRLLAETDTTVADLIYNNVLDYAVSTEPIEFWRPNFSGPEFRPLTPDETHAVLDGCRGEPRDALELLLKKGGRSLPSLPND